MALSGDFNIFKNSFDFDFGGGRRFPRISPAALADPNNSLDPGPGTSFDFGVGLDLKPTDKLNLNMGYSKSRLKREDTDRLAYDSNIFRFRSTYQFSRFVNFKARID